MKCNLNFKLPSKQAYRFLIFGASLAALTVAPSGAATIVDELGSAGPSFWAIVTDSTNPHLNGPGTTNGNVAVTHNNGTLSLDSSNAYAITGNVSLAAGASVSHPAQVTGSIFTNVSLNGVLSDATTAASYFQTLAPTNAITSITNSTMITSSGVGATNVLSVNNFNLGHDLTLTLKGDSTSQFIINISGGMTLNAGKINLVGGLLPSDVLFNVVSGNLKTSHGLNDESVINGIVLVSSNGSVQMSPGLINGELISLSAGDFQIVSGGSVNQTIPPSSVPEPSTYPLSILGLAAGAFFRWRRQNKLR